jgi:hypothetical protein
MLSCRVEAIKGCRLRPQFVEAIRNDAHLLDVFVAVGPGKVSRHSTVLSMIIFRIALRRRFLPLSSLDIL